MKLSTCVALVATSMLLACASNTGVVPMGRDTYMIANTSQTAFASGGEMVAVLYRQADEHCRAMGKELQPINERSRNGAMGQKATGELQFRCLAKSDPELRRPTMETVPDMKVEVIQARTPSVTTPESSTPPPLSLVAAELKLLPYRDQVAQIRQGMRSGAVEHIQAEGRGLGSLSSVPQAIEAYQTSTPGLNYPDRLVRQMNDDYVWWLSEGRMYIYLAQRTEREPLFSLLVSLSDRPCNTPGGQAQSVEVHLARTATLDHPVTVSMETAPWRTVGVNSGMCSDILAAKKRDP